MQFRGYLNSIHSASLKGNDGIFQTVYQCLGHHNIAFTTSFGEIQDM